MNNKLFVLFVTTLLVSCNYKPEKRLVAIVNGNQIYEEEVDSLIKSKVIDLKHQALNKLIGDKLLILEANNNIITVDTLLSRKGFNNIRVNKQEINQYLKDNNQANIDNSDIMQNILSYKKSMFMDSLKNDLAYKYNVSITLPPSKFDESLLEAIEPIHEIQSNKDVIYMIFNYSCDNCIKAQKILFDNRPEVIKNYTIKLIYFDYYIHDCVLYSEQASKLGKFDEMHQYIINQGCDSPKYPLNSFANNIGIDTLTMYKEENIMKHILNRNTLLKIGIDQVPLYIINNQIFRNFNTFIEFLENE